jgi:hypothetical protein
MNSLWDTTLTGTLGELITQTYLLAHGVQATPPIKDSGNDLIAVRGTSFKAVQVKTSSDGSIVKPDPDKLYHILATVHLPTDDADVPLISQARVFLFPREMVEGGGLTGKVDNYPRSQISDMLVIDLWT